MVVGLILEANPYHHGHKYLISQAKSLFKDSPFIAITSTSYTMRGEISLIDKFDKTKILLDEGIDIVFELPISFTLQSADYFCYNTVHTLYKAGVTDIVVGCEDDNFDNLITYYNIINSDEFINLFKQNQKQKLSYKSTYEKTLSDLNISPNLIELFNKPNMTLAFQYYRVIKDNNYKINLHLIKRTTDYYQKNETIEKVASASYIRELYLNQQKFNHFLPYKPNFIDITAFEKNLITIINFQMISYNDNKNTQNINGNTEGILNYIYQNGTFDDTYTTLINSLKNKRYSENRIRRTILSYILNIPKGLEKNNNYLRILGISNKGTNYLSSISKQTKQFIFANPNELKKNDNHFIQTIFSYELLSTKLYGLLTNNNNLYLKEYQLPLKKEGK